MQELGTPPDICAARSPVGGSDVALHARTRDDAGLKSLVRAVVLRRMKVQLRRLLASARRPRRKPPPGPTSAPKGRGDDLVRAVAATAAASGPL